MFCNEFLLVDGQINASAKHEMANREVGMDLELLMADKIEATKDVSELRNLDDILCKAAVMVNDKIRRLSIPQTSCKEFVSFDGRKELQRSIQNQRSPWSGLRIDVVDIPGMISDEEAQYYNYICDYYTGGGEVVELGPWLGKSTYYITKALIKNPYFKGHKLNIFDDFIWRADWMNDYLPHEEKLKDGVDFQYLFEKYTSDISNYVDVKKRKFVTYGGNDHVEQLKWDGAPIEIMYIDCGRTIEANEAWYKIFSKSFIPGKTLLIMQDWRLHRQVPVQWYNQTKLFTESKMDKLEMIHELISGDIATFLYHG